MCINRERGVERLHSSFLFGKREEEDDDDDDEDDDDNTGSTKAITTFVFLSRVCRHKSALIGREDIKRVVF